MRTRAVLPAFLVLTLMGVAAFIGSRKAPPEEAPEKSTEKSPVESQPTGQAAQPGPGPGPAQDPGTTRFQWGKASYRGLEFPIPKSWAQNPTEYESGYIGFSAPDDDDFKPQLQVYWRPSSRSLEEWSSWQGDKARLDPEAKVLAEGKTYVAGAPAVYLIYQREGRRDKTETSRPFTTIDFYFVRGGHDGMLRGVATGRTFRRYRPVFDEIARRLRYVPASSASPPR